MNFRPDMNGWQRLRDEQPTQPNGWMAGQPATWNAWSN